MPRPIPRPGRLLVAVHVLDRLALGGADPVYHRIWTPAGAVGRPRHSEPLQELPLHLRLGGDAPNLF